jgi:hypothetical protein
VAAVVPDFTIKRGDRLPSIEAVLKDAANTIADLSGVGVSVRFLMTARDAGVAPLNAPAVIVNGAAGRVRYDWQVGDTQTVGVYYAEFEVTFLSGKKETFPNARHLVVLVEEDLG